ncbi:MAG TPA: hypothetical protein VFI95_04565 [Terriglobales bacterium]|nr:hypothetical protein [Terriglobales bacterium]
MLKKGRILRDPLTGPGLLIVEGQQYPFLQEGVWRSDVPAKPGMAVQVEFDGENNICGITAIPERQIAAELADPATNILRERSTALLAAIVGRCGWPPLIAEVLLISAWCLLTAIAVQLPFAGKLQLTFWQLLGYLNSSGTVQVLDPGTNPGAGLYGLFAIAAMLGPFFQYVWRDKRAALGGILPLTFTFLVVLMLRNNVHSLLRTQMGSFSSIHQGTENTVMNAVSFGWGTYLAVFVGLYFAALSLTEFLQMRAVGRGGVEDTRRATA